MSSIPPKTFSRNKFGLLENPPIPYVFNDDGSVNWRKMVKPEFLVPNKQRTQETDISKLEDKDLLILLGGIKELAQIRGFTCVSYEVPEASSSYVIASCYINWIGNYETDGKDVSFQSLADASPDNTQSFARNYLAAIAENSVRNFLRINIVGQDEIDPKKKNEMIEESQPTNPASVLNKVMSEVGLNFEVIKNKLIAEHDEEASGWDSISDIPKKRIFEIIERIKRKNK